MKQKLLADPSWKPAEDPDGLVKRYVEAGAGVCGDGVQVAGMLLGEGVRYGRVKLEAVPTSRGSVGELRNALRMGRFL